MIHRNAIAGTEIAPLQDQRWGAALKATSEVTKKLFEFVIGEKALGAGHLKSCSTEGASSATGIGRPNVCLSLETGHAAQ